MRIGKIVAGLLILFPLVSNADVTSVIQGVGGVLNSVSRAIGAPVVSEVPSQYQQQPATYGSPVVLPGSYAPPSGYSGSTQSFAAPVQSQPEYVAFNPANPSSAKLVSDRFAAANDEISARQQLSPQELYAYMSAVKPYLEYINRYNAAVKAGTAIQDDIPQQSLTPDANGLLPNRPTLGKHDKYLTRAQFEAREDADWRYMSYCTSPKNVSGYVVCMSHLPNRNNDVDSQRFGEIDWKQTLACSKLPSPQIAQCSASTWSSIKLRRRLTMDDTCRGRYGETAYTGPAAYGSYINGSWCVVPSISTILFDSRGYAKAAAQVGVMEKVLSGKTVAVGDTKFLAAVPYFVQDIIKLAPVTGAGISLWELTNDQDYFTGQPLSPANRLLNYASIVPGEALLAKILGSGSSGMMSAVRAINDASFQGNVIESNTDQHFFAAVDDHYGMGGTDKVFYKTLDQLASDGSLPPEVSAAFRNAVAKASM